MKRLLILLTLSCVFSTLVHATTLTLQPDAGTGLDVSVRSDAPTVNQGTVAVIPVGEHNGAVGQVWRALIKFTGISALSTTATIIDEVYLKLYIGADYSSNSRTVHVYRLLKDWVEAEATWNVYSTGNAWTAAGAFDPTDCEQTDIGSVSVADTATGWVTIPLTLPTKDVSGFGDYGFLVKVDTETDDLFSHISSDHATPSLRPQLVVIYHLRGNAVMGVR